MAKTQIIVVVCLLLFSAYSLEQRSKYWREIEEIAFTINKFRQPDQLGNDMSLFEQELKKFEKWNIDWEVD